MSDLWEAVTFQFRAVVTVASPLIRTLKVRKRRLGGSAASLPVRGFM
jgi:hypothetical protein